MADAIDFSRTKRIVLLIDLNPLLQSPNPNPNYLTTILAIAKTLLSFHPLSSSLFSFKLFVSSLSPLLSASAIKRILPNHNSNSLSFNPPSQTLDSLSNTLNSISFAQSTYSCSTISTFSTCSNTVGSLLQIVHEYDWESEIDEIESVVTGNFYNLYNVVDVRSNLVILLSPVCRSLKSVAEFMCCDVNGNLNESFTTNLDGYLARFCDRFAAVNDAFVSKDIHFCWVDVGNLEVEVEIGGFEELAASFVGEIRRFGWGFCSADSIVFGSALVSFGLVYPNIVVSSRLLESCGLGDTIRGQLTLEILDVSGKPLECKCCDLELLPLKRSSKPRFDDIAITQQVKSSKGQHLNFVNKFLGGLNDGIMKLHVTAVQKYTKFKHFEESLSDFFIVQSAESSKKGKGDLDKLFANRVLELLAGEDVKLVEKKAVPTWHIFLNFLYREGNWALVTFSNGNGDSHNGILKPLTVHSAVLLVLDDNSSFGQNTGGKNLLMNESFSQDDTDCQNGTSSSRKHVHVGEVNRRKMKKHMYQDLTWSSFRKAAYEFTDVDLAEVYFANGLKKSKKLKFLKCWMKEVKNNRLSSNSMPLRPCQTGPDLNQQKGTDMNETLATSHQTNDDLSDQSGMQDEAALLSCPETLESFFINLPRKIKHGLEADGMDLKILAESFVNSSIYWLRLKHEAMENLDESCTVQVAEIIKLLLREPKDLNEHKDNNPGSTSKYLVREYELQILLRLEILQSEYAGSIKGSVKTKLVKQICSLLEIFQYLVEGGFHGDVSLYDYVERTIKRRYSQSLGDVVDKIYDQMDLLPFGEENEDQALVFNSEDSSQSWRDRNEKNEKNDMSASKLIQDSLSMEDESCHQLEKVNDSPTKDDHEQKLNEARERRERARRFVSSSSRMPDLQRVWAPKQSKTTKVKPEPKRKKHRKGSYSVVCETPLADYKPACSSQESEGQRGNKQVSKALFQDD